MVNPAHRINQALTFQAVEFTKKAQILKESGRDIISLGIGEPDFTAPPLVIETLNKAAQSGLSGYSPTLGLMPLRICIADYYNKNFGTQVTPEQIIVTTGASGALLLACQTLFNPGDEVIMPDPYYPANYNFILASGAQAKLITCDAKERFQLSADKIRQSWTEKTRGVLIASPSNPTGTSITQAELKKICDFVRSKDGIVILDEIYLGLSYDGIQQSGLVTDPNIIIINSFSKYFNMTGWRLGWIIAPQNLIPSLEKYSASVNICAPTLAQHAAISCFHEGSIKIYEQRRLAFKERRDYLLPALEVLKLNVPVKPDGAFYIYADISHYSDDSHKFATDLLEQTGVVVIPGLDFGPAHAHKMIRLSYATNLEKLKEAINRLAKFLKTYNG